MTIQQGFHGLVDVETSGAALPERGVVHGAGITQEAIAIDDEDVGRGYGFVQIGYTMSFIDQDKRQVPSTGGFPYRLGRLDLIRSDGQHHDIVPPLDKHRHQLAVCTLGMRAFAGPEVQDHDLPLQIAQLHGVPIQVGECKIGCRFIDTHEMIITT